MLNTSEATKLYIINRLNYRSLLSSLPLEIYLQAVADKTTACQQ